MCGCSMALRYDDRGSNLNRPYYNGQGGGGNETGAGKGRTWNEGACGGRFAGEFRDTNASADQRHRKYERKEAASGSRNCESWEDRSNAGDSDKAHLRQVGDWTEQLSSAGKKYYYNCRTEVSQWEKPTEWLAWEKSSGLHEASRKRRSDRHAADEANSPSHSSAGQPSGSHDQGQWRGDDRVYREGGRGRGRGYGRYPRRPYANHARRGETGKYARKDHFYDGQQRHDQNADCSGADRERRKRPLASAGDAEAERSSRERSPKRPHFTRCDRDNLERSKQSSLSKAGADSGADNGNDEGQSNVQIDMERLPHLLVEIAEKNNIDLSDPDALEKIKRHLKTALCSELSSADGPSKSEDINCHLTAVSDDEEELLPESSEQRDGLAGQNESPQSEPAGSEPAVTRTTLKSLFNEELTAHVRGWSAQHFETQATQLANMCFRMSLDVSHISADLKCARSLVRTAEIRSTLLEQRIAYLRHQYHELETMSKPSAGATASIAT